MADYNKLTVANLRQLLKDRHIPSTGLTRKAQIIEKLGEADRATNGAPAGVGTDATVPSPEEEEVVEEQDEAAPNESELRIVGYTIVVNVINLNIAPEILEPPAVNAITADQPVHTPITKETSAPELVEEVTSTPPAPEKAAAPEDSKEQNLSRPPEPETTPRAVEISKADEPQSQTADFETSDITPSPAINEKPSVEKPELLPIPERSANSSVEPSRINSEEAEADNRKRKRRSQSPDVASQDIRAKKPRPSRDPAPEVHLKEDTDVVMAQRRPDEDVVAKSKEEDTNDVSDAETGKEDALSSARSPAPISMDTKGVPVSEGPKSAALEKKENGARFKDLFKPTAAAPSTEMITDDRPIVPALHPATPALYIRDLMRPLRIEPLRNHLVSLASPPSASPDASIVKALFIDSMKSHALVLFSSITAASRVRASLHNSIWPPEGQRKELWVDFIPEDKVEDWIREEEDAITAEKEARAAGRPIPAKRFEIVYHEIDDGGIQAVFQELGSSAPFNAPKGPKSNIERKISTQQPPVPMPTTDQSIKRDLGKSFQTLDTLFSSTVCKPKLYYLEVSDEISERRLDELHAETSRDWRPEDQRVRGRGVGRLDQKMRFSFDKDDRVVEVGGDFGPWADDNGGFRGGRGGRGGGFRSDRGGFRGRGGWRG